MNPKFFSWLKNLTTPSAISEPLARTGCSAYTIPTSAGKQMNGTDDSAMYGSPEFVGPKTIPPYSQHGAVHPRRSGRSAGHRARCPDRVVLRDIPRRPPPAHDCPLLALS